MASEDSARKHLESMLLDESVEPKELPISLLESITNNFSNDYEIGSGGFAVVYKGLLGNGTVAVKKLSINASDMDDDKFIREAECLIRVKHKNVVRFLGYCADAQGKISNFQGKPVIAEERLRLLCFEFLPKGSLDNYITDASQGLEWTMRYQIIRGICDGLHYLHQHRTVHLDLKPANILLMLDRYMVAKIADFGLSKCFDEKQTRLVTSKVIGSLGYMAPEYLSGNISFKSDIYSLGVIIIEILTRQEGYPEMNNVLKSWAARYDMPLGDVQLEPVRVCAEIGMVCMNSNPEKRPDTLHIIETLNEMESKYDINVADFFTSSEREASSSSMVQSVEEFEPMDVSAVPSPLQLVTIAPRSIGQTSDEIYYHNGPSKDGQLLDFYPLELRFPFEPKKVIQCPLTLTNKTDHSVVVYITPICQELCTQFVRHPVALGDDEDDVSLV